jgi:hypothetical protein
VFYGEWFAALSTEERVASIQKTLGQMPERFWIVLSRGMSSPEQEALLEALSGTHRVVHALQQVHASAYLLVKR